jgi:hypothetical protein
MARAIYRHIPEPATERLLPHAGRTVRIELDGWPALLHELPGYAPHRAGEVLSLTRALPWWNYRTPKPSRPRSSARSN